MLQPYVHGYSPREAERLRDQAATVRDLIHADTRYPDGTLVLEPGCGVGAQTVTLATNSPGARFMSVELDPASVRSAYEAVRSAGIANASVLRGDLFHLPFRQEKFDAAFVCFVLEHLPDPHAALTALLPYLKPGATVTAVEGDHGSCYWHPETRASRAAWQCLIDVQAGIGGDSLIGRRLYPLLAGAGLRDVSVSPRFVYCDASRPTWVDGFVRRTIIPMVEGVREDAVSLGMIDAATFDEGVADLHAVADSPEGVFCYTFFKGVGVR